MINNNLLELIVTDLDIKSHKKYFEVMKKYRDYAIITINDDIIYSNDLIESLYNSYLQNPNCIHARCVHKIMREDDKILPFDKWLKEYKFELNPSFSLFAISEGGILFPPNILNISDENLNGIYKFILAEDIYLKYISRERNIKIIWVPNNFCLGLRQLQKNKIQKVKIYEKNIKEALNYTFFDTFPII